MIKFNDSSREIKKKISSIREEADKMTLVDLKDQIIELEFNVRKKENLLNTAKNLTPIVAILITIVTAFNSIGEVDSVIKANNLMVGIMAYVILVGTMLIVASNCGNRINENKLVIDVVSGEIAKKQVNENA